MNAAEVMADISSAVTPDLSQVNEAELGVTTEGDSTQCKCTWDPNDTNMRGVSTSYPDEAANGDSIFSKNWTNIEAQDDPSAANAKKNYIQIRSDCPKRPQTHQCWGSKQSLVNYLSICRVFVSEISTVGML